QQWKEKWTTLSRQLRAPQRLVSSGNYCHSKCTCTTHFNGLLADFFTPVFKSLLYDSHELVGHGAIDNAMVVAECEMSDRTDGDGICAVLVGDHHGLFGDAADAHDGRVRLVDDGQ